MKTIIENKVNDKKYLVGIELLINTELHLIRGGNSDDKSKTQETDVYDKREI
jgi:hypothetical protein